MFNSCGTRLLSWCLISKYKNIFLKQNGYLICFSCIYFWRLLSYDSNKQLYLLLPIWKLQRMHCIISDGIIFQLWMWCRMLNVWEVTISLNTDPVATCFQYEILGYYIYIWQSIILSGNCHGMYYIAVAIGRLILAITCSYQSSTLLI